MSEDFIKERNEVFASCDKKKILEYCEKYNIEVPKNEDLFWAGVHKVICNLYLKGDVPINTDQYYKSEEWLKDHGYSPLIIEENKDEI